MNTTKLISRAITVLIFTLGLFLTGCETNSPMATDTADAVTETVPGHTPNFLKVWNTPSNSLQKTSTVSKWINAKRGGHLNLNHSNSSTGLSVSASLYIPPGALQSSRDISITVNDDDFIAAADVIFGPHGSVFNIPVELSMNINGIDLTGVDSDDLTFYYLSSATGEWEEIETDVIIANPAAGSVYIGGAELPHFSRYGIAAD